MPPPDFDAAVIGAGAAGLTAAAKLTQAGLRVVCIEARDRIGGRIRTIYDSSSVVPVELGAEFIHGRPPEIWECVREAKLTVYDCAGSSTRIRDGVVQKQRDAWDQVDQVIEDMERAAKTRDQSFAAFLEKTEYPADVKQLAINYVEGFNAAHKEIVGIRSLAEDARAGDAIDGDRGFRILSGYASIPQHIAGTISPETMELHLNVILREVRWRAGHVELLCEHAVTSETLTFRAKKAVFAVPLGVLQNEAIRWSPAPPRKSEAAKTLAFGQVARVILRFRESFWERQKGLENAGFLFSNEAMFPVWWTTLAVRAPILTGWSAGPHADDLLGKTRDQVITAAMTSLAKVLGIKRGEITDQLQRAYFHDWHADRFACGAYSYVPAGAMDARKELAAPVEETLFFSGEATELDGYSATVHGAIRSGLRAAKEMTK